MQLQQQEAVPAKTPEHQAHVGLEVTLLLLHAAFTHTHQMQSTCVTDKAIDASNSSMIPAWARWPSCSVSRPLS